MSRKRVAHRVLTPRGRRQQQKRKRHNDDIHDEDVENQQPSPHPKLPIILPQAFLHAPNTFKPASHIGVMNNTSYTVLNFTNAVYSMRSYPETQTLSLKAFKHYISVHCPKTRARPSVPASLFIFMLQGLQM